MSEENADTIRTALDSFARADVEGFLPFIDREVHFEPHLAGVEGSYEGHDGVKRFFEDAFEAFEIEEATYPDIRDLGDQVLVLGTLRLNGRESGLRTESALALVVRFKEELVSYLKDYADREQALEAVGPSE